MNKVNIQSIYGVKICFGINKAKMDSFHLWFFTFWEDPQKLSENVTEQYILSKDHTNHIRDTNTRFMYKIVHVIV